MCPLEYYPTPEVPVLDLIKGKLDAVKKHPAVTPLTMRKAHALYVNGQCQMLTCARDSFHIAIDDEFRDFDLNVEFNVDHVTTRCNCKASHAECHHAVAGLMELSDYLRRDEIPEVGSGKTYTREGMIKRVLEERREKAEKADYRVDFADNPFGEHELFNERGRRYKLTFRDLEGEQGYCSCPDYRTNKLGTCKHLMHAFTRFRKNRGKEEAARQDYPFVEILLDPLNDYRISWFYPHELPAGLAPLIAEFFTAEQSLIPERKHDFLSFVESVRQMKEVLIRSEVLDVMEEYFEQRVLAKIRADNTLDFSGIGIELFPYQKEGIEFAVFRKGAIIADEMGLGKTLQAIGTAVLKKDLFGFERTLVICPASLKDQWKREIERFSREKAVVIQGAPEERAALYKESDAYFLICNYEATLRDLPLLREFAPDFIILDEAQRIKNYETQTAGVIKQIPKKHALVITGTPIENRLVDLYSIVDFLDPHILSPLWEFSYRHCCFDPQQKNKITGYYNLQSLKERLQPILVRREKKDVLRQLPHISHLDIPVEMHPAQADYHADYANGVARILRKKYLTPFDLQKLQLLLAKMRMVCDSTFLVDPDRENHHSPKLDQLRHILLDQLDLKQSRRKIVIFSEWVRMNHMIGRLLRENDIGFVELSGKVPVARRSALIKEFETNPDCRVFLSTEAGGAGLNLQIADTVINFELPWNPAKKNQRIGRIDRLGQQSGHLTVINLITKNSIEERIAEGLLLKQDLFEGVLSPGSTLDAVDFANRGRPQFLQQLEAAVDELTRPCTSEIDAAAAEPAAEDLTDPIAEPGEVSPDEPSDEAAREIASSEPPAATGSGLSRAASTAQVTQVMNQGMAFLSGLMQMATGQGLQSEEGSIEVNPETGEVVMKFKLPGFAKE
jgi:SNF2 family DNA or RNA helicase